MLRSLAQRFRVIFFDKRGQGLSDRFEDVSTLDVGQGAGGDAQPGAGGVVAMPALRRRDAHHRLHH